jgi:hypothetical protein
MQKWAIGAVFNLMVGFSVMFGIIFEKVKIIYKTWFQGAEQLSRRLLISLCVISGINIVGWTTPSFTPMILSAMNLNDVDYANIFSLIADTSIELGMCAMCPALYAIKYEFIFFWLSLLRHSRDRPFLIYKWEWRITESFLGFFIILRTACRWRIHGRRISESRLYYNFNNWQK